MTVYHGTRNPDLNLLQGKRSRYGIPGLFCSTKPRLAEQYRDHYHGHLYELQVDPPQHEHDFVGLITRTPQFRNLIYELFKNRYPAALIRNCLDYPHRSLQTNKLSDILVVFDVSTVKRITLLANRRYSG